MGKYGPLIENLYLRDLELISMKFAWVDDHRKYWKLMGKCSPLIENFCLRDLDLISLEFSWVDDPWKIGWFCTTFVVVNVQEK